MRYVLSSLLFFIPTCCLCAATPTTGHTPSTFERMTEMALPRSIQVLIEKNAEEALLEVRGPYYLFNPLDGSRVAAGLLGKRFMIRELSTGLKWGEEFLGIHQLYIKPRSPDTSIFINGIQYSGGVFVYGVEGKVHIVNEVDMEAYVKSILTTQFSTPMEPEVMAALAIVARTESYYESLKGQGTFWHIQAKDSGYMGSALIVSHSPIDRAVDSTKHLILVHPSNGKNVPFAASWTEHSAGKTAAYETIFRFCADAPEKGVEAPHALLARQESKWTYQIPKKKFSTLLGARELETFEVFIDSPSGKVYGIRIKDGNEFHNFNFLSLQAKLGKENLPSSDFTVALKDDTVHFTGFGKGHGVGLCLYSASALAQNGENAVKILAKFFPETYLCNVNALPKEE
ncbi:MAG TPA: SpoIID/LytB domain-containing protein [Chlamydiales bacterium]|nr:SpoIID/LytB domain-containing protein [Chlamydiales bacterium]